MEIFVILLQRVQMGYLGEESFAKYFQAPGANKLGTSQDLYQDQGRNRHDIGTKCCWDRATLMVENVAGT